MKRIFQWAAVAVLAFSLSSCGLPAALGRTAGNAVKSTSGLLNAL